MTSKNVILPREPSNVISAEDFAGMIFGLAAIDTPASRFMAIYKIAERDAKLSAAPQQSEEEMIEMVSEAIAFELWSDEKADCIPEAKAALKALGLIND